MTQAKRASSVTVMEETRPTFQVRIHGRGGQGVVTAAELLSVAAFDEGRHAQAFPSFGSERSGAPVVSFCRIADRPIRAREPIAEPDALIVQDPTLLHQVDLFAGLDTDGHLLINTCRSFEELGLGEFVEGFRPERTLTVPATELARAPPRPPAAQRGAARRLRRADRAVSAGVGAAAIREKFPGKVGEGNVAAADAAFGLVEQEIWEAAHA